MLKVAFLLFVAALPLAEAGAKCTLPAMTEPHATVIIYRWRAHVAAVRRASIYVNGKKVCSLHNGRYIVVHLPAGKHVLRSSDEKHGGFDGKFENNKSYYFRVFPYHTGAFQMRNYWMLHPITEETAIVELRAIKAEDGEIKEVSAHSATRGESAHPQPDRAE